MRSDINSIIIEGKVEGDPDAGTEPNGMPICRFPVKSRRGFKSRDDFKTEFVSVTVTTFGNLAQKCAELIRRNGTVRAVGRLSVQDGELGIVAEHVEIKHVDFKPVTK